MITKTKVARLVVDQIVIRVVCDTHQATFPGSKGRSFWVVVIGYRVWKVFLFCWHYVCGRRRNQGLIFKHDRGSGGYVNIDVQWSGKYWRGWHWRWSRSIFSFCLSVFEGRKSSRLQRPQALDQPSLFLRSMICRDSSYWGVKRSPRRSVNCIVSQRVYRFLSYYCIRIPSVDNDSRRYLSFSAL